MALNNFEIISPDELIEKINEELEILEGIY